MDQQLLQRTRYVLRSRARRVQACPPALFISACRHLLHWVDHHLVLSAIVHPIENIEGEFRQRIAQTVAEAPSATSNYDPGFYSAQSSQEHTAVCLTVLQAIVNLPQYPNDKTNFVLTCLGEYLTGNNRIDFDGALQALRDVAVDGLYEYLDEQLDARNVLYAILLKYKQRSEWFHRMRLRKVADDGLEGKVGERALAIDLQSYILDQGVEFVVEPASASGEVDLVLRDAEGRYIIVDAKYIPENATRSIIQDKIASGFNQVSRYCNDFNESEGFLVAFVRTPKNIRVTLEELDGLHLFKLGGKTVYYIAVDIADLPSASKLGRANEFIFTREELVGAITD